jgi:hypothetical protein
MCSRKTAATELDGASLTARQIADQLSHSLRNPESGELPAPSTNALHPAHPPIVSEEPDGARLRSKSRITRLHIDDGYNVRAHMRHVHIVGGRHHPDRVLPAGGNVVTTVWLAVSITETVFAIGDPCLVSAVLVT